MSINYHKLKIELAESLPAQISSDISNSYIVLTYKCELWLDDNDVELPPNARGAHKFDIDAALRRIREYVFTLRNVPNRDLVVDLLLPRVVREAL